MSTLESYETWEFAELASMNDVYAKYLEQVPNIETKNGVRQYDLLCAAMQSGKEKLVVGKDRNAHIDDPTDWLVIWDDGNEITQGLVLGAKTTKNDEGDEIELELAADVSYHGPFKLRFGVNKMYGPNNKEITLSHLKYYGRGVGVEPEEYVDNVYDKPMIEEQVLAEVIPIEVARERRQKMQNVGHTALIS